MGHKESMLKLADLLEKGTGVAKDPAKAARLRKIAGTMK